MKKRKISLGVNIDHIATLRQVRGGTTSYPDLVDMAKLAMKAGADQITIHLREDRRHIQLEDLDALSNTKGIPLNLEMALTPEMEKLAIKYKPEWVCLVPEKRKELTTEGGLDVVKASKALSQLIPKLQKQGIKVSLFIGPSINQVNEAAELGADAVEFHTGHWVNAKGQVRRQEWHALNVAAEFANKNGLRVHAGHGLDFETAKEITALPHLREVNIGHSIVCYSVEMGLTAAIKKTIKQLK
ncbi:MAG: hypothetical protein RJB66_1457 [Pseudomonadota bacterium]|jgi:pyridoxine 5-phosphate synthase